MFLDQFKVEAVVPRRDRGVGGKNDLPRNAGHRLVKTQALVFHTTANCFQHGKRAVAFIHVKYAGRDSHRFQRAEAADA